MFNRRARSTPEKDFKTLKTLNINLFFNLSYSGSFKFKRKTYILIACSSFIYLNFILKSCYCYLVVKLLAVNDELGIPIILIIINQLEYIILN